VRSQRHSRHRLSCPPSGTVLVSNP
jgi:hypothetical protein